MKYSVNVSSSRRKSRRDHFSADSESRRVLMSANVDKELKKKHGIRSLPIRKDDEVKVVRGDYKGREGKVMIVYRSKFVIHIERVQADKANGAPVQIGIHPSNCVITKIKMDKDRKNLIARKAAGRKEHSSVKSLEMVD